MIPEITASTRKSESFEVTSNVLEATHFSAKTNLSFDSKNALPIQGIKTGENPVVLAKDTTNSFSLSYPVDTVVFLKKSQKVKSVIIEVDLDTASMIHALAGACNSIYQKNTSKLYAELSSVVQHGKYSVKSLDHPDEHLNITVEDNY